MKIGFFDIETPYIPATGAKDLTNIFCIGIRINDEPVKRFSQYFMSNTDGNLQAAVKLLNSCDLIVSFNGINFDVPVIERVLNCKLTAKHLDLIIVSKLIFTKDELFSVDYKLMQDDRDLMGSFSLKAFGRRMGGAQKLEFHDFSKLSSEMLTYMDGDIDLTAELYYFLKELPSYPSERVLDLEQAIATIIQQQVTFGFHFDIVKAREYNMHMLRDQYVIERKLAKKFLPKEFNVGSSPNQGKLRDVKTYTPNRGLVLKPNPELKRFKNGRLKIPAKSRYKWFGVPTSMSLVPTKIGVQTRKFNPSSRDHIKRWLKEDLNFEFTTFTEKGAAKVDGDELISIGEDGKDLKDYLKLAKDISQLGGTDNSLIGRFDKATHSIHGRVDTIGAATHRATHSGPNLAQIPADGGFRALFNAPKGWKLVGADLANIEIRVLAHYLAPYDGGKYAEAVLSKDMHWYHAKVAGFWTEDDREWPDDDHAHLRTPEMKAARTQSKGFFFGYLYGQGDTIRGNTLWFDGCLPDYTEKEYKAAKNRVERRVNDAGLFPLKKDQYVKYTEQLILETIYGKRVADTFLEKMTGIKDLIADCGKQSKEKGTITAIDGRELYSRSPHSALNLLLQGSAGVIAKQWAVNFHTLAEEHPKLKLGKNWKQNAFIHDEYQCACKESLATTLGDIMIDGCNMIQKQFDMNIIIAADYQVGMSWADTH